MSTTIHTVDDPDDITSSVFKAIFDHEQAHGRLNRSQFQSYMSMPEFQVAGIRISQTTLDKWRTEPQSADVLVEMGGLVILHEQCPVTVDPDAKDNIMVDEHA